MSRLNPKASLSMKAAWDLARKGQRIYGGTTRQYLAEALRQSWAEVKGSPVTKAADELRAMIRANREKPPVALTPYLAQFSNRTHRRIWADSRL